MKRDSNRGDEKEPDWDSFEVYKGEEEKPKYPRWLQRTMGVIVIGSLFVGVFLVCGFLTMFIITQPIFKNSKWIELEEGLANAVFMAGGFLGVLILAAWWFKTPTH